LQMCNKSADHWPDSKSQEVLWRLLVWPKLSEKW
jgi:hypothetical protein